MAFQSFGVNSKAKKLPASLRKTPIAEFAEPSADDAAEMMQPASPSQRETEANELQASGSEKAECGDFSGAIRQWNRALLLSPQRPTLHEMKSQVLLEVGQVWEAVQSAGKAVEMDPQWPDAHLTLARAQLALGEPEAALTEMEAVLALQPEHLEATEEISNVRMLVLKRQQDSQSTGQRLKVV